MSLRNMSSVPPHPKEMQTFRPKNYFLCPYFPLSLLLGVRTSTIHYLTITITIIFSMLCKELLYDCFEIYNISRLCFVNVGVYSLDSVAHFHTCKSI